MSAAKCAVRKGITWDEETQVYDDSRAEPCGRTATYCYALATGRAPQTIDICTTHAWTFALFAGTLEPK